MPDIYRVSESPCRSNKRVICEEYSDCDVSAEQARQRSRGIANSFMEEMEDAARASRRQDKAALGRIDSILADPPPAYVTRAVDHAKRAVNRYDNHCYGEKHAGHGPRAHSHPPGHAGHHANEENQGTSTSNATNQHHHHHHHFGHGYKRNPYALPPEPKVPISEQRKKIERRLDHLLDYEMPSADNFYAMRAKLRNVNEKMLGHKLLIDRYSGVELAPGRSVDESVQYKYQQLAQRMPELENYQQTRPPKTAEEKLYYNSPRTTVGYTGSLMPQGQEVSELRGRIRRLVCRSKANPHYYRM